MKITLEDYWLSAENQPPTYDTLAWAMYIIGCISIGVAVLTTLMVIMKV